MAAGFYLVLMAASFVFIVLGNIIGEYKFGYGPALQVKEFIQSPLPAFILFAAFKLNDNYFNDAKPA